MSWQTVKLGELMGSTRGSVDPSKYPDELFELFSIPSYDAGKAEMQYGKNIGSSKQVVNQNDVLISKIVPHIRRAWVVNESKGSRQIASSEWIVFRSSRLFPAYFRQYLLSDGFFRQFMQTVSGVGGSLLRAKPKQVAEFDVLLPPLPEQKRIAAILDKADELKRKREAAIAKLDQLAQSIFVEMFGERKSNLKNFSKQALCAITEISTGSTPSRNKNGYMGGTINWVKTTEVNGDLISDTEEKLTDAGLKSIRGKLHPVNSIIVAMYGQGKTRGRSAMLALEAACNQACGVIRPNDSFVSKFMFWQLQIAYQDLRALGRGGNQENLNLNLLGEFEVLLPPLKLQNEFANRISKLEKLKAENTAALVKQSNLFTSLQHQAFAGHL